MRCVDDGNGEWTKGDGAVDIIVGAQGAKSCLGRVI